MENEIYTVLKEYTMDVEGLNYAIKGMITKRVNERGSGDYFWSVSHYCKPSKQAATIYIPSRICGDTFDEAEQHLMMYMTTFTTIDVTPNDFF